ncbi:MAG TPA: hypothetical protein PLJ35_14150 [Anaerolineae bacterium]|nr:hypothetical protein [Anaerolineae bacterium]HOQ99958.1 hypothetical protein [Anaerolineae bacterium]HPL28193.1 hypothetical protein [Anaerolineae bacterium]
MAYRNTLARSPRRRAIALALGALLLAPALAGCATATPAPTAPATVAVAPTQPPAATAKPQPTPTDQPLPGDTPVASAGLQAVTSQAYGVTLQCPAAWKPVATEKVRYEGDDGFLMLSLISGEGLSLAEVAGDEAHHRLQPYGSAPTVEPRLVPGRGARLILPSADQPAEMHGQAAIVALMPEPVQRDGVTYNYLVLWADQAHIADIGASLTFAPRG